MSGLNRTRAAERGFTMVEVMVAMVVFSIVTIGIVPLLGSAMKGATVSRASSVGEELARDAMERIRGIKYFTSFDAKPNKRVDLLDLYYPQVTGTFLPGQSYSAASTNPPVTGAGGVFTTVCQKPFPSPTNPACPAALPNGYALTFTASFVKAVAGTTPQTYQVVTPASTYRWDTSTGGNQLPADLMDLAVTASWDVGGRTRTFTLRSIVGDRQFSPVAAVNAGPSPSATPTAAPVTTGPRIRGRATVDYTFHGETGFSSSSAGTGCPTPPCKSEMVADIGVGESRIELQDFATADQFSSYGNVRIVRTYPSGQTPPATPPDDLANVRGATSTLHAPPTLNLTTDALSDTQSTVVHPDLGVFQSVLYNSENRNLKVGVDNELPIAEGTFGTKVGIAGNSLMEYTFNNTQRDSNALKYTSGNSIAYLQGPLSGWTPPRLGTFTSATTGALGTAGRGVTTSAESGAPQLSMFRVTAGNSSATTFVLQNFKATVNCKSTANPATASATATWTTTGNVYYDDSNNGRFPNSMTGLPFTLNSSGNDVYNGASVPNALANLRAANPLIWDGSTVCCSTTSDIYLFEEKDGSGNVVKRGYFRSITSNKNPFTYVSPDGRTTQATIEGAIRIDTATLNPAIPETAMNISMAKLSCESVDNR